MSRLALYLLGPPRVELDGEPIRLDRHKALALLAYLAVTGERQRRDALVNLLWPEYDSRRGRGALRRTLYALNQALPGPWLDVDREEVGLTSPPGPSPGRDPALWVDVLQFRAHLADCESHGHAPSSVCAACVAPLTEAVTLARGEFMDGFGLKDSFNFDDWSLFQAEALRRELAAALQRLAHWHSTQREFEPALGYARRWLELDPLDEQAHRALMRLYTWSGRRSAALRQYEECVALLQAQLGVPPQDTTTELCQAIQEGLAPPLPENGEGVAAGQPPFLKGELAAEPPVFVAREHELAQLDAHLERALAGQGRVVFVTGDAGSGKTALIQEFARRAQEAHLDLVIAGGQGNAQTGIGDPYLPFREILGLLTGDAEAQWAAGAMNREQARRLWHLLPLAVEALVKAGPDLVGLFVPGPPLLERAAAVQPSPADPTWLAPLTDLVSHRANAPGLASLQQSALFEQYTQTLRALAAHSPLLLAVDDLQWADGGSLRLLFHLGRRLAGSRILLLGAYRPAEVALGRPAPLTMGIAAGAGPSGAESAQVQHRHPLEPIVNEFKRAFGAIEVDLECTKGRPFVDALLDSEPNCLGQAFREALHQHTRGHPLFTVELLRGMQERGDLVQDSARHWVEGTALDWETLPARVEAVVAERIDRLPPGLRDLLRVASVEGETFTAEVAARVQAAGERETVRHLSETLDRQHRLVSVHGIRRLGPQRLSHYRFRHTLFQKYLYSTVDAVERVYLHEQVGGILEELYQDQEVAEVALQLARHFEEAGMPRKASHYLHQAGERALVLSATREAMNHLTRGLALLMTLPDSRERNQQELALQLALGVARISHGAFAREMEPAYARARDLGHQVGKTRELCQALGEMAVYHYVRAEHHRALELAQEALDQAQQAEDPLLAAWSRWHLGFTLFCLGEFATAQAHLEHVISFYDSGKLHRSFIRLPGADAGLSALAYSACCLWCLGYPEQALARSRHAVTLAQELGHPFSLADVLCYAACLLHTLRRDAQALKADAEALLQLAEKAATWMPPGMWHRGVALSWLGQVQEGMAQMREAITLHEAGGKRCYLPVVRWALAEAQAKVGQPQEALSTLDEALAQVEETDERHWEPELHRLRAELLLRLGHEAEAEASLNESLGIARRQQAKFWELRSTVSLARLWQGQGNRDEARQVLGEIYGWFTEGFDTIEMREARALLQALA